MTITASDDTREWVLWIAGGVTLLVIFGALFWISPDFWYGRPVLERPIYLMVALLGMGGLVYWFLMVFALPKHYAPGHWWLWMLSVGVLLRLLMLGAAPMLEDDYYRYLWDGAVVAHMEDPFAHSPAAVVRGEVPSVLSTLAQESGQVLDRVNHPELRTIYPGAAQIAFAAAHHLFPWRIEGLRIVWFTFDVTTMALIIAALRTLGLPSAFAAVYWWNPLLLKEAYNSAHMELLLLPFLIGALLLAVRTRLAFASVALALAAGVKLWPAMLFPLLFRINDAPKKLVCASIAIFSAILAVLLLPLVLSSFKPDAGLTAYASYWQMNDSLYMLVHSVTQCIASTQAHQLARGVCGVVLLAALAWAFFRGKRTPTGLFHQSLWLIALLFFLSPTQFPWYALWFLPLLCVHRSPGLLLLSVTLPIYYLRFPMDRLGWVDYFDYGVVWLQYLPVYALLAFEIWRKSSASKNMHQEGHPHVR